MWWEKNSRKKLYIWLAFICFSKIQYLIFPFSFAFIFYSFQGCSIRVASTMCRKQNILIFLSILLFSFSYGIIIVTGGFKFHKRMKMCSWYVRYVVGFKDGLNGLICSFFHISFNAFRFQPCQRCLKKFSISVTSKRTTLFEATTRTTGVGKIK